MISRRIIRVKVMQTLYTISLSEQNIKPGEPQKLLQKHFDQSKELVLYFIYFLSEVPSYAETDAYIRSSKHLPTAEDLNVNTKIAGNELLWKIKEDGLLKSEWEKTKPQQRLDKELVRKLYLQLTDTQQYKQYIATASREWRSEKEIIDFILESFLLPNELFIGHLEESFSNWDDDGEMVVQLVKNYLHKPGTINFEQFISSDKAQFARSLLQTVLEKSEYLEEFILPKLKNWDPDRIAALDMILMKMGVAEFLYFETIPPKVTINEYIELAKEYSTQQSGQFVNGILDNIHKELAQQNKLHKIDFKKA
ncbi:MAG: transcription antitermination factor NusB [Flavisolibacter sp.]|nr:transcription antitermination factor NusB [Flavisolibacter sp.]MBD0288680.1 transcription antitermination factor NusB [Flavisolibacter sp.]MBD0375500.1 transcription antitermination factor NusB [Flavisolibacter sp.]